MRFWRSHSALDKAAATPVRHRFSPDFSLTGLVYVSMMMFMLLAAVNSQANLLFAVFGLMLGVLGISAMISKLVLQKLRVQRALPEQGVVGQTMNITYEFQNTKRYWPSLSVSLGELNGAEAFTMQPMAYMLHAAGGMAAHVPIEVVPKRRGLHTLDRFQLFTSFPFGFIKRGVDREHRDTFLAYPPIGTVDPKLLTLCRSAETSGAMMRPRRGGMDEFYGVKEYREGENPRWIYWRRSARTGVLVAKEMTKVSPPRVVLLLDTFLRNRSLEEHVRVEQAIAMAASLASHALQSGLAVGLMVWSEQWLWVAPGRGKRHRRDVLAELAQLPLNTMHDTTELLRESSNYVDSAATPVLLTPRDVQVGLADYLRSGMVVISAGSDQAKRWFRFDESIDFATAMPQDQQPRMHRRGTKARSREVTKD